MRVIVIGTGAAGASATAELARRGHQVTALERFSRGHVNGSSHGTTRVFRVSYRNRPYTEWAGAAIALWRELEERSGEHLLEQNGQIDHGFDGALAEITANYEAGGWSYERLSADAAMDRWPGMRFESDVLFSPDGGRVFADRTIEALLRLAEADGADLHFNEPAVAIARDGDGVIVETADGRYAADIVVVAAGAWVTELRGWADFAVALPPLAVTEQFPVHFPIRPSYAFPSWINHNDAEASDYHFHYGAYGLETPGEGLKVGVDQLENFLDLTTRTLEVPAEAFAVAAEYAERWLPGVDTSTGSAVSCLFTMTEDSDFVLDRRGPIVVASPCSGHGFKFTPILGRILADLAEAKDHGVEQWRLPA